jgi:hypothetical protein
MVNGRIMRLPSFTSELSGPTMRERITSPLRRSSVCSPPVKAAFPSFDAVLKKPKVPWLPRRSGTHIPDSSSPLKGTGGNVMGTRWMIEKM